MIDYDEYLKKQRAEYGALDWIKLCLFWRPSFYIGSKIEELKYKLYVRLYCYFDCIPPEEDEACKEL